MFCYSNVLVVYAFQRCCKSRHC